MNKKRIAVFGSAFNPPHRGHEDVIKQAQSRYDLVIVVPSYRHAFGKDMAPFDARMEMTIAMVNNIHNSETIIVTDIEKTIAETRTIEQPVYTYEVLLALESRYPSAQLKFVLGPDNADPETWKRFYHADDIIERWGIWVAKENIAVRSTQIRNDLIKGVPLSQRNCPPAVIPLLNNQPYYRSNA